VLQKKKQKKKATAATLLSPSFFVFFAALQRSKEGDDSVALFFFLVALRCSEEGDGSIALFFLFAMLQRSEEGDGSVVVFFKFFATLQHSATKKARVVSPSSIVFFTALQCSEEGDDIWFVALFPCNEMLCLFFPKSKIKYVQQKVSS